MLVLARIDAAVLVATLAAFEVLRKEQSVPARLWRAVTLVLVAATISLPWWLYNVLSFGSLMPSSGTAQSAPFALVRIKPMLMNVLVVLVPYVHVRFEGLLTQMVIQAGIVLLLARFFWKRGFIDPKDSRAIRMGGVIAVSTLLLGLYYLLTSGAVHFYGRYLAPLMLVSVIGQRAGTGESIRGRHGFTALVPISLVAVLSIIGYHFPTGKSKSPFYNDQLQLIASNVPSTESVSAGQSGTIGYFREHVVNLDGKVNPEALHYRHNTWEYLKARNIRWYCDWSSEFLGPDPAANGWVAVGQRGAFLLYHHAGQL
jgi:hypothetical protein